jgi:lipopolysaccharide transport system ATP-binding protein
MASDIAVAVRGLSKSYTIAHNQEKHSTLAEELISKAKNPFRRVEKETFWALKDVSFDIKKGDVVGIIGRNGAGKSTLLKILSRITEPTAGRIHVYGHIGSLLEVGTGFHPELTGRENIYLNGAILGMAKSEIKRQFDAIVGFAEIEKFLDTPVKRYSSGMYVRLAFAVAAHLNPEILIVDEVLAVGDAQFQKKCLGKMRDVAIAGRTVFFVSHNMMAVQQLCTKGMYLSKGTLALVGDVKSSINAYLDSSGSSDSTWMRERCPQKPIYFHRASVELRGTQPQLVARIQLSLKTSGKHKSVFVAMDISEPAGTVIMQALPRLEPFIGDSHEFHDVTIDIKLPPLIPGKYFITLWAGPHNSETSDLVSNCISFEIEETPTVGRTFPHTSDHGFIVPESSLRS